MFKIDAYSYLTEKNQKIVHFLNNLRSCNNFMKLLIFKNAILQTVN